MWFFEMTAQQEDEKMFKDYTFDAYQLPRTQGQHPNNPIKLLAIVAIFKNVFIFVFLNWNTC